MRSINTSINESVGLGSTFV